jgi:hypothetical protein
MLEVVDIQGVLFESVSTGVDALDLSESFRFFQKEKGAC